MSNMSTETTQDELHSLTVSQLRAQLKKRKLGTNGKKQELINRLLAAASPKKSMKKQKAQSKDVHQRKSAAAENLNQSANPPPTGDANGGLNTADSDRDKHLREMENKERQGIVLWRAPVTTVKYFLLETSILLYTFSLRLYARKKTVFVSLLLLGALFVVYHAEGAHQETVDSVRTTFLWCAYWVGLGVLSSVGLGTGLHTFLLYLGPHIAAVTLAAYECMSVDFPEPPYPTEITCPEKQLSYISIWHIISKVRLEAFMWGAGTAIGELPPYFMARAARLSGADLDDDDFEEIEELIHEKQTHPDDMTFMEKAKLSVHNLVQRVGFFGILLCASIPNPLFDLAGITCGHFLIPFWTFFGATLIGKAIIKMHIQKLFVIFLFSEHHVETLVSLIGKLPKYGSVLQTPFKNYLAAQRKKLHQKPGTAVASETNMLGWIFEKVIIVMVAYFVLSIINSMAQSYHKRECKKRRLQRR